MSKQEHFTPYELLDILILQLKEYNKLGTNDRPMYYWEEQLERVLKDKIDWCTEELQRHFMNRREQR